MNKTKIISDAEIKEILGNVSGSDYGVSLQNQVSINMICDLLGVNNLAVHSISKEKVLLIDGGGSILFRDFPVDSSSVELYNDLNVRIDSDIYYREHSHSDQILEIIDSVGRSNFLLYGQALVANYDAGFTVVDTVEFLSNATNGQTITVSIAGTDSVYTFKDSPTGSELQIGGTKEETAQTFATATGGSLTDAIVSLPLGTGYESATVSVSATIKNIPEELRIVCAYIAGGNLAQLERVGGVVSYRLGDKSVNFRNEGEAEATKQIIEAYIYKYKTPYIIT